VPRWAPIGLTATAVLLGLASAPAAAEPPAGAVSRRAIRELLERPDRLHVERPPLDSRALARFYRARDFRPAWAAEQDGRRAALLLDALAAAEAHGLDSRRYRLEAIRARRTGPEGGDPVERELLLTDAFLRYATDMRRGRLVPGQGDPDWGIAPAAFDAVAALTRALRDPAGLRALLASLPPPAPEYGRLVEALGRYRDIASRGEWPRVPSGALLRPGASDERVPALRQRLVAEGDLASGADGPRYDEALEPAVRRFQARHGLVVDGIVGPATIRALNVPVRDRIRQITLNLERWRWLPRDLGHHYITVNAADAMLSVVVDGRTVLTSRVVVGDARHPTPVVAARLEAVVFNPPWNVPVSIAVAEMLPRLRENPRYLADNDIVVLERREGDPFGLAVDWAAVPSEPFPFRLQQQPGPGNPLGRIKLDIPNRFDVYLHDSPVRSLFARPVRTASHGCIRVERADDLAAHVLGAGPDGWTKPQIAAAIATGASQRIPVARPVPVYILYWTAFVAPDGLVHFRDDVYGRDGRLDAALAAGAAVPGPARPRGAVGCPSGEEETLR
jgi:murein L,D-transpeptidase YcbB/YkuD